MPGGDGKGPPHGKTQRGGRMGGTRPGSGPGGECVCPACGTRTPHRAGIPCNSVSCPECGTKMVRGQ